MIQYSDENSKVAKCKNTAEKMKPIKKIQCSIEINDNETEKVSPGEIKSIFNFDLLYES